ncbi:MAG: hypothetical protein ACRDBO_08870 [Lachnospiraceae bacterium]
MILLNMYGKIGPIIISKKLGVGICNPAPDWIEEIQDDFEEEILIHKNSIETYKKSEFDTSWAMGRYNLENIVKQLGWKESEKEPMQIIAEHLIEIQVLDFDNSLLQVKNEHMDNPTCEPQYSKKLIKFCCELQSSKVAEKVIPRQIPFAVYDSDDFGKKPLILNHLESMLHPHPLHKITVEDYTNGGIASLKYIGQLIDDFLDKEEDFWLLDYIINAMFFDSEHDAYHIFKTMSLIEMLIINPKGNGKTVGEIEKKLPQFLPDFIAVKDRPLFAEIMRKLRNKIGHGDFKAVQSLLEQYRQSFMQNFWYDEFEYSIENWTYGNICINLDQALREILWLMLSDKANLKALQCS